MFSVSTQPSCIYITCLLYFFLKVIILDVRVPCTPVARLNNHRACVNGIAWAPHSSCHICTAGKLKNYFYFKYPTSNPTNIF